MAIGEVHAGEDHDTLAFGRHEERATTGMGMIDEEQVEDADNEGCFTDDALGGGATICRGRERTRDASAMLHSRTYCLRVLGEYVCSWISL